MTPAINSDFQSKIREISLRGSSCSRTQNLVISLCCFVEAGYEMYRLTYNARAQPLFCSLFLLCGDKKVVMTTSLRPRLHGSGQILLEQKLALFYFAFTGAS